MMNRMNGSPRPGRWRILLVHFVIALGCNALLCCESASALETASHRRLRYREVVGQTDWSTCGPAALATLFNLFGESASEAELVRLATDEEPGSAGGFSMLTLKNVAERKGHQALGFRLTDAQIQDYFLRGGLPILAHVTKPNRHFIVLVGLLSDGSVLVFDPSWGRSIVPLAALRREKGFEGASLVVVPPEEKAPLARRKQREELQWAEQRLRLLSLAAAASRR